MNKSKKTANIYFITSVICYIAAGLWYMNGSNGLGTMWLCIGSANYCIGYIWLKRSKKADDQKNNYRNE